MSDVPLVRGRCGDSEEIRGRTSNRAATNIHPFGNELGPEEPSDQTPHFPERSRSSRTSGPSTKRTVARSISALQDNFTHFLTVSALGEADPDRGLKPPFDELVEHADDAVELVDVEVFEEHATDEIHVAVRSDREVRA